MKRVADAAKGECNCVNQYGSSNGEFGAGPLGDCAHFDTLYGYSSDTATRAALNRTTLEIPLKPDDMIIAPGGGGPFDLADVERRKFAEQLRLHRLGLI